jgi:Tfp pilus assembly protein FimT
MTKSSRNKIEGKCTATAVSTITLMIQFGAPSKALASEADYRFLITSDWQNCQQISSEYQDVYAFETKNFQINICQKDGAYFYLGEAKQSDKPNGIATLRNSIFIPAYPLNNKRGFQAVNGNVAYVVVLPYSEDNRDSDLPKEAILTIKRNGRLVSVESSLNKYCHQSEIAISKDSIKPDLQPGRSLATLPQHYDLGWNLLSTEQNNILPPEIFNVDSRFDFYRMDGELHRLTTCD